MKVLIGTTNPSKVQQFKELLGGHSIEFMTPADLRITQVPPETGQTPVENAVLKAKFYSQFCDQVICADSGLYIMDLPLVDPRQPGLHVRSPQGTYLSDDESMLSYYINLMDKLGSKALCCYLNGIVVWNQGCIHSLMESDPDGREFYMVSTPHPLRHPGCPLDSISIDPCSGKYFVEPEDTDSIKESVPSPAPYQKKRTQFLLHSLGLA